MFWEEEEEEYSGFEKELRKYLDKYEVYLSGKYTPATARKHCFVIDDCIFYVCNYCEASSFDEIKFSHISSKFYRYFIMDTDENMTRRTVFNIVRKFFEFVQESEEINPELMRKIENAIV